VKEHENNSKTDPSAVEHLREGYKNSPPDLKKKYERVLNGIVRRHGAIHQGLEFVVLQKIKNLLHIK
jgi:hypothetical protein